MVLRAGGGLQRQMRDYFRKDLASGTNNKIAGAFNSHLSYQASLIQYALPISRLP